MVGACRHAVLVSILASLPAIQPSPPYALSSKPKLASPGQTGPLVLETLYATSRLWQYTVQVSANSLAVFVCAPLYSDHKNEGVGDNYHLGVYTRHIGGWTMATCCY